MKAIVFALNALCVCCSVLGDIQVNWVGGLGFYRFGASYPPSDPSDYILHSSQSTSGVALCQLIWSPDTTINPADPTNAANSWLSGNDILLSAFTNTSIPYANYDVGTRLYSNSVYGQTLQSGYIYARVFQDSNPGPGEHYNDSPIFTGTVYQGMPPIPPQMLDHNQGDDPVYGGQLDHTMTNILPSAAISAPDGGWVYTEGWPVSFAGSGNDPEFGALTGGSLVWKSSIDAQFGTGASFSYTNLSAGQHTITLHADDGCGGTGTASRVITIDADTDRDGMPDWWELAHFGNITNAAASADDDGDGQINFAEWMGGSIPTNDLSAFALNGQAAAAGGAYILDWPATSNRHYSLLWGTSLDDAMSLLTTNVAYLLPGMTYTDAVNSVKDRVYYRVRVTP